MNIFRRLRRWIITKYLPAYVRESDKEDISALKKEIARLNVELIKERAYSNGLEFAARQRIIIHTEKGD